MAKKGKGKKVLEFDGKAAAAGTDLDLADGAAPANGAGEVFDGPLTDEEAIAQLIELNHVRNECEAEWDRAKTAASDAKKELDNASNAISLLIDRVDRQRNGLEAAQPVLRTVETSGGAAAE